MIFMLISETISYWRLPPNMITKKKYKTFYLNLYYARVYEAKYWMKSDVYKNDRKNYVKSIH